ncbi:hypothetical protein [Leptolyngbya sp. 7M]|uniref:Uncharacterized protein n=1 Tax=Leptolyngbya sp. NK1-12 TaxID=2547451 RepID=A0AA97AFM1_9CYAN|nr:hypothetical protein [Leptolyngbya sp. 7M]MBF2050020.1 hypothetical protein [Elainella sp. C42_A2020_010]QYO63009.1 hypothetical protein JVX88_23875 [Leptolyngbya sp. 7M]RNJ70392.1 MAG: hypothetical protein EDM05_04480 [Leptolyngbya sp. IPPAS B-1204]WNZ23355.1 hypothetical protein HJG54_11150 [Leptolyngbya sp. NK1-12]
MKSNFNLNLAFLLVFFTTTSFTLLSGGCSIWLATNGNLSQPQTRVFETCNATWNMGIGAIFGLLGSKATDLLQSDQDSQDSEEE